MAVFPCGCPFHFAREGDNGCPVITAKERAWARGNHFEDPLWMTERELAEWRSWDRANTAKWYWIRMQQAPRNDDDRERLIDERTNQ